MAVDRLKQLKEALDAATANGWEFIGRSTVRRKTEHTTPDFAIDAGWYPSATYSTCEFLSFVMLYPTRVPKVIYGTSLCPWVGRQDRHISYKKALDLLVQPLDQSEIHDRD